MATPIRQVSVLQKGTAASDEWHVPPASFARHSLVQTRVKVHLELFAGGCLLAV